MEEEFEKWYTDYQTSQEFKDQGWSQTIKAAYLAGCEAQRKRDVEIALNTGSQTGCCDPHYDMSDWIANAIERGEG